jgi:hypothetical protein
MPNFLLQILISLVLVGLVLWVVGQIPMDPAIAKIIRVVAIVLVVLWLLGVLMNNVGGPGLWPWAAPYPYRR